MPSRATHKLTSNMKQTRNRINKQKLSQTPISDVFLKACKEEDFEKVRACLTLGVDINCTDDQTGHSGLFYVAHDKKLFDLFIGHPDLDIDQVNRDAILSFVACYDVEKVRKLCNLPGIDVNAGGVHAALVGGSVGAVEHLLQQSGLNLDVKLYGGRSVGHIAVKYSPLKCVELLSKDPRVNWNVRNDSGDTPIMVALKGKRIEVVKILLRTPGVSLDDVTETKEGKNLLKEVLQEAEELRRNLAGTVPECPICLNQFEAESPVFQCSLGHLVCGSCRPRVKHCHSCRGAMMGRAHGFEKFLRDLKKHL